MILLDTCALLWLAAGHERLSEKARDVIAANAEGLFVSAISAFEIAVKVRSGKLTLPLTPPVWFGEALEFHGIHELPVTSAIAMSSVELPLLHRDPCDRIIIASAKLNGMGILTCDRLIAQYDEAKVLW
jgi:PIN domain nuclease of toxin-antitoxin system